MNDVSSVELVRINGLWAVLVDGVSQGWFGSLREASRFVDQYLLV